MSTAGSTLAHALAARLGAELVETHISWVLLAGELAWKIKKPLRLAFVDYGSLQARRHCCEEELRLNRRLAPTVYLDVAAITGTPEQPVLDGPGEPIEYAVRMRRFAPGALFSERLAAGLLQPADIDACAALLAHFHQSAPAAAPDSGFGDPARRREVALRALDGAAGAASAAEREALRAWLDAESARLTPLWRERLAQGRVRECHGDLHLANLVVLPDGVAAFDGIEFDPQLRWTDVVDDIAFPVMDLHAHGRADLAFRLLNQWLDWTGDHAGLPALRFAAVYRALVRAQVECMQGHAQAARAFLDCALAWAAPPRTWLAITHGLPGSGKTHVSQQLLERQGAVRLRSDVERKRLFGLGMLDSSRARGLDIYGGDAGQRTYARVLELARGVLAAGFPAIVDAAFLRRAERDAAAALARGASVPFRILHCEAPEATLRQRLLARRGDASEADAKVLAALQPADEPLGADERASLADPAHWPIA